MSIYSQFLSAIIFSTFLAFLGSLTASTFSTRAYLVEQLSIKNQDNASALALSLTQSGDDQIDAELVVSAQFDGGNYKHIRFIDNSGKVTVDKVAEEKISNVPFWFINLLSFDIPEGNAKVSRGWKQLGTITLESYTAYAYQSLWKSTVQMALSMSVAAIIGCMFGVLIIRRLKRPLAEVVKQASAISDKRFITIAEPRVPELKKLANAMNLTVISLKQHFEEEADRLEALRREAHYDPLTGLCNRNFFMSQLGEALNREEIPFGVCLILRVSNLGEINKKHGRREADKVILAVAKQFGTVVENVPYGVAGRLNGSDFAIIVPCVDYEAICEALMTDIRNKLSDFNEIDCQTYIGIARYKKGVPLNTLLSRIDMSLASAENVGGIQIHAHDYEDDEVLPSTMDDWAALIKNTVDNGLTCLVSYPVLNRSGQILHWEGPLRIRSSNELPWMPAGRFLPIAERLGLTGYLDIEAVRLGLSNINQDPGIVGYCVNISASSLNDEVFMSKLKRMILDQSENAKKLWLEFPEYGVHKYFDEFSRLCIDLKSFGVKVGIEHFGRHFDRISLIYGLGVDYIKVDSCFVRDIESNNANLVFLKGLLKIAHEIGLLVVAEGVLTNQEMNALIDAGFDGVTGAGMKVASD